MANAVSSSGWGVYMCGLARTSARIRLFWQEDGCVIGSERRIIGMYVVGAVEAMVLEAQVNGLMACQSLLFFFFSGSSF